VDYADANPPYEKSEVEIILQLIEWLLNGVIRLWLLHFTCSVGGGFSMILGWLDSLDA